MTEPSAWIRTITRDPDHSHRYADRWRRMIAEGADVDGEARLVDAMCPRGAHILDAGCGQGRVSTYLQQRGHRVVGVDVDPVLIDYAKAENADVTYLVGDLAELDLPGAGIDEPFDLIVSAGNVMGFLAPSTRGEVLRRLRDHLAPEGRLVIGYGAGRGYEFGDFAADAQQAGLTPQAWYSSWDIRPFTEESGFLVAVFGR